MRILVADDDSTMRTMLEAWLKRWGHEAVLCYNGADAWVALQKEDAPRMAILDWMMPEMDGVEVCRRVREKFQDRMIYILLLTAKVQEEDLEAGLGAGADDYVTKPCNHTELRARVQAGVRILKLQSRMLALEQDRVVMRTAGAAAHRINQPLTLIMGLTQMILQTVGEDDPLRADIEAIHSAGREIEVTTKKMEVAHRYAVEHYVGDVDIVDFDGTGSEQGSLG